METIIAELMKALSGPVMAALLLLISFISWKQQVRIDRMEAKINDILVRFLKSLDDLKHEVKDIKDEIKNDIKDVRDKLWHKE